MFVVTINLIGKIDVVQKVNMIEKIFIKVQILINLVSVRLMCKEVKKRIQVKESNDVVD